MAKDSNTQNKSTKEINKKQIEKKEINKKEEKKPLTIIKKSEKKDGGKILDRIDNNRVTIITGVVCFLIATLLFRCILWPDRIATLSDGTQPILIVDGTNITADELYEDMKKSYSVNFLINKVDTLILNKIYPDTEELNNEVKKSADNYYSMYQSYYGYTKEEFLSYNGFSSEEEFIDYLKLENKRNDYFNDSVKKSISEKEVEKYYKNEVYGDVDTKHILVNVNEDEEGGLSDKDALAKAKEIIKKLKNGTTWEDVIKEYKDYITDEELGYQAFNASLESNYLDEMRSLKVGTYSSTPVKTSYGYHIVYKIAQKDKPELDEVKETIIDILANEIISADKEQKLFNEYLTTMRTEYGLEFFDSKFAEEYNKINK